MKRKNNKKSGLRRIIPLLAILTISLLAGFITQKVTARGGGHGGGHGGHGWHGGRGWGGRGWGGRGYWGGGWGWGLGWGYPYWGYPYGYYGYGYPYYGAYPYAGITIGLGGSSDKESRAYRDSNGHNFWEITNATPMTIYVSTIDGGEGKVTIKNFSTRRVRRGQSFDFEVNSKQGTQVFHCNKHFVKIIANPQGKLDAIDSKSKIR